jgi:hypothetical protein
MHIELSTIPIYLCAMYSIKKDNGKGGSTARVKILGSYIHEELSLFLNKISDIAQQEMLHLALVGNMYTAVGGTDKLYDPKFVPRYPMELLYQKVDLELAAATKKNIENFLKVRIRYRKGAS